jgi:CSLREA domain-containing protein
MLRRTIVLICGVLGAMVLLLPMVPPAAAAPSTHFVVTTTDDSGPQTSTRCDTGYCTLRAAIVLANTTPGAPHTIDFNIGTGLKTITPLTELPPIVASMNINGFTQQPNRGTPLIEIDGTTASRSGAANGLTVRATAVISGLAITRWSGSGIHIEAAFVHLFGNYIGIDPSGTQARPNTLGVKILTGGDNEIGGVEPFDRNVISGNTTAGIYVASGSNRIEGNYIGTNAAGTAAVGNGTGIDLQQALATTVGGQDAGQGNLISGNLGDGARVVGGQFNRLFGNRIGVASDGTSPLGNGGHGVLFSGDVHDSQVGTAWIYGQPNPRKNDIGYNGGAGIRLSGGAAAIKNIFSGNSLVGNGGLGIDIGPAGVTTNDPGDGDDGPNRLQNFPTLLSAATGGQYMTVTGTLDSQPGTYQIEFYLNAPWPNGCDQSGYGEAQTFLGYREVTVTRGPAWFQMSLPPAVSNSIVTAIAVRVESTNPYVRGDTSEISQCVRVGSRHWDITSQGSQTTEAGGQATFTVALTSHPTANVTMTLTSLDTTEGTVSPATLTFTPQNALQPQTVTVTGVNDSIVDGDVQYQVVTGAFQSTDPGYNGLNPPDLTFTNKDNDIP